MMGKVITSFKNINHKLFISLLVMGFVPTVYTTLRVFWLGNLPGDWAYSIAGQLAWVNLIYEVVNEAIILPLFYFVGKVLGDKRELTNRMKTGLIVTLVIYALLSAVVIIFARPLLSFMAADATIIGPSVTYIRIEAVANVFGVLSQFALVGLVTLGKSINVYIITGARLVLCLLLDLFLVSSLSISANWGVNGIGISNIIVNAILLIVSLGLLAKAGTNIFNREKSDFKWIKEFVKVGGISGLESFIRNFAYMVMIARMVNVVSEQGTYWVANNFIWGWLLLPVNQLGELIKREIATDKAAVKNNTLGYFMITGITVIAWIALIPLYKPFMANVLGFEDVDKLFGLVMLLLGFYVLYAIQNVFDASFYGLGKTHYMLFESVVTNSVFYGIAFVLWICGVWQPTLYSIALLFGLGNAFDTVVSLGAYWYLLRKNKLNILDVERKTLWHQKKTK